MAATAGSDCSVELLLRTEEHTRNLGAQLARVVGKNDVIFLNGTLAAGKTTIARSFIRHFFQDATLDVPSPTYLICLTYTDSENAKNQTAISELKPGHAYRTVGRARVPGARVLHLDPYRLAEGRVASLIDVQSAFAQDICLVEWPERLGPALATETSPPRLEVTLGGAGPQAQGRRVTLRAIGCRWAEKLGQWVHHGPDFLLESLPSPNVNIGELEHSEGSTTDVCDSATATKKLVTTPPSTSSPQNLLVLGIESSCDDTGAAVVRGDGCVLGEALASQSGIHEKWGGVMPSAAQEAHRAAIDETVELAIHRAGVCVDSLSAIAVTVGPGLSLCLEVGVRKALQLCQKHQIPLVRIHHMEAHTMVSWLPPQPATCPVKDCKLSSISPNFPFLTLLVSGGHNMVVLTRGIGDHRILGSTLDDSIGEAFDKTARLLGISQIPGGPALERLASKGDAERHAFPRPLSKTKDMGLRTSCDFSYSGLKSSVRLFLEKNLSPSTLEAMEPAKRTFALAHVAASFQKIAVDHLCERTRRAIAWAREEVPELTTLVVAGGVAANTLVRERLTAIAKETGLPLVCPPPRLCVDNGVMVAWTGVLRYSLGLAEAPLAASDSVDLHTEVRPRWAIGVRDERSHTQQARSGSNKNKRSRQ